MASLDEYARQFLEEQRVAHLATADASGSPHVVPVCFAVLRDSVYIAIDEKPKQHDPRRLKRVRNVLANPRVALVADVYDEDWSRLGFLLVHGKARVLEQGQEYQEALVALRGKYEQYRAMTLEGRPVIAIDVESTTPWGTARATEPAHGDRGV